MKRDIFVDHSNANEERRPSSEGKDVSHPLQQKVDTSPRQREQQGRLTQLKDVSEESKSNGLPSLLRTGIEALSGMDMSGVVVHRNSSKPAELNALAYAQGNDIHLGPGQDKHLPHEAWHVVQQAQGRVKPTTQLKGKIPVNDDKGLECEADVMGDRAMQHATVLRKAKQAPVAFRSLKTQLKQSSAAKHSSTVLQGVFLFVINTDDYTLENTQYFRVKGKFLTGNKEEKHVTADSVKDNLWTGMEGMTIMEFTERLLTIVDEYEHLPGLDLIHAHKLDDDEDAVVAGINGPMRENYKKFIQAWDEMSFHASQLRASADIFKNAQQKKDKDAAAFHVQNSALVLIGNLDKFRDLMPLVNVISGLQKRGNEREAKAFLESGEATRHIDNANDALWAFFDFAAIDELGGNSLVGLRDSVPWLDIAELTEPVMGNTGKQANQLTAQDYIDAVAGVMLANHIRLTRLSYPEQCRSSGFGSAENVRAKLNEYGSPVTRATVVNYATGGWDFFRG